MLKVNVGLSRKLSKDYQSTGFSVNIEGEVTAPTSDPETVVEQVKELYDLAEEALDQQIERSRSVDSLAGRDEERPSRSTTQSNGRNQTPQSNDTGTNVEPATEKQINYLLTIGKRQRLSTAKLETKITDIIGQEIGIYDLTKRQAAQAIDALTTGGRTRRAEAPV